ncbi:hypothetical protein [Methylobacterium oxalidis]|uniref:Uncharacterized protein n=1 Tax=Methylobacterium oxalidis TaxID=944322 RepID=A0A512J5Q5_9HYPH|nr:hypothetical protein [Methylobacterium oxalidis]GEP05189.1 hypothetical protein MOX02_32270 [Methylobacterium oxalidis]GLS66393.1 hypothetical protein GCM10007888_47760 [Methylobacterium oxalidis]
MNIDGVQLALLLRLRRGAVTFTGVETADEQLAMLQLYTLKLVVQVTNRKKRGAMEWHLTTEGRQLVRELRR